MSKYDTKVLNSLIATTIDSARGYEEAADRASDDRLKADFGRFARDRRETADRLKEVAQIGGSPNEEGTLKAAAHRRWLDLKDFVSRGDSAILDSVEAGETYLCEKYEAALSDKKLSLDAHNAVVEAYTSVARGKAEVSELRRQYGIEETPQGNARWGKLGLGVGALAAVAGVALAMRSRRRSSSLVDSADAFTVRLQTDESMRMISSKKVEGTAVYGRDGERIGEIASFMVDKYSGRVGYAVMTFGGIMGFGQSLFPLPWSVLTYDEENGGYRLPITSEQLANAPRFEASDEPEFSPEYRRHILLFYRPNHSMIAPVLGGTSDMSQSSRGSSSPKQSRRPDRHRDGASPASSGQATAWQRTGRDESPAERLAAGRTGQDLGQSSGSDGSFGSPTGGSFGAPNGSDPNQSS